MRDDGDFIKDLRHEILTSQNRRIKYVVLKLGFIVGLFGAGSLSVNSISLAPLIYLTTLVIFVFDLYIIGEDFGVKRAGRFILGSPGAPPEERRWENTARLNRDPVTRIAGIISSLIVVVAAAISLWKSQHQNNIYFFWLALSIMVLIAETIYGEILVRKLEKLDKHLRSDGIDMARSKQQN